MNKQEALKKIAELQQYVEEYKEEFNPENLEYNCNENIYNDGEGIIIRFMKESVEDEFKTGQDMELLVLNPPEGYEFKIQQGRLDDSGDNVLALVKK